MQEPVESLSKFPKVCEGVQACTPWGVQRGGAKVRFCEGNSRCTQPKDRSLILSLRYWKVRRPRSYELEDCPVGYAGLGRTHSTWTECFGCRYPVCR